MDNLKVSPKDFFLHLGVIASLYTVAAAFINLAWRIIDFVFPSEIYYGPFSGSTISGPVATLIVVFPIFILLSWLLNKEYKHVPGKRGLWFRKWLVYITLFVAGIVIVVDLIVVLVAFLGGELITTGFILKALSVFVVALAIFGYYIADLRESAQKINRVSAWIAGFVVLALIITGFSIMGSPRTQRLLRYDEQKVAEFQNIQWQIVNFWQGKEVLPKTLKELEEPISGFIAPTDPQTGENYKYEVTGKLSFRLCADFNLPSTETVRPRSVSKPVSPLEAPISAEQDVWSHGKGEYCFERTIDPKLYPPRSKI